MFAPASLAVDFWGQPESVGSLVLVVFASSPQSSALDVSFPRGVSNLLFIVFPLHFRLELGVLFARLLLLYSRPVLHVHRLLW